MIEKIQNSPSLPIYDDVYNAPNKRLKFKNPLWNKHWKYGAVLNNHLISDPTQLVPGLEYPPAAWTSLNRVRIEQGRYNYLMHKWEIADSPICNCS